MTQELENQLAELNVKIRGFKDKANEAYKNKDFEKEEYWDNQAKPFEKAASEIRMKLLEEYTQKFKMTEDILAKYENSPITLSISNQGLVWAGHLNLREVSGQKTEKANYIYFKVDGMNAKTGKMEQLKLYLHSMDGDHIIERIQDMKAKKEI